MTDCPSRFTLVQLHVGELSPTYAATVRNHSRDCRICSAQLEEIEKNARLYDDRMSEHSLTLSERLRTEEAPPQRLFTPRVIRTSLGFIAAAAAITVGFALLFSPAENTTDTPVSSSLTADTPTYKGTFSVQIYARRSGEQFEVTNDAVLRQGDQLRFAVTADAPGFLSAVSVDQRGAVSPFYPSSSPEQSSTPYPIAAAGETILPGSIVLDQSSGTEFLMVLFSQKTFDRKMLFPRLNEKELKTPGLHDLNGVSVWIVRITKKND